MKYPTLAEIAPPDLLRLMESYRTGSSGCWLWTAGTTSGGYGHFHWRGVYHQAHRFMYGVLVAIVPDDLSMDHLCRVRACVNPAHLEPVTAAVNAQRGQRTRLSPDEVAEIRSQLDEGYGVRQVARARGLSHSTVSRIRNRLIWRTAA